jgi:hypothetical protein
MPAITLPSLFGAVADLDPSLAAGELVIRALLDVLESSPATDVVNQDVIKVRPAAADVVNQLDQTFATMNAKAAAALVSVSANDDQTVLHGIDGDGRRLVLGRVSLMVR